MVKITFQNILFQANSMFYLVGCLFQFWFQEDNTKVRYTKYTQKCGISLLDPSEDTFIVVLALNLCSGVVMKHTQNMIYWLGEEDNRLMSLFTVLHQFLNEFITLIKSANLLSSHSFINVRFQQGKKRQKVCQESDALRPYPKHLQQR